MGRDGILLVGHDESIRVVGLIYLDNRTGSALVYGYMVYSNGTKVLYHEQSDTGVQLTIMARSGRRR